MNKKCSNCFASKHVDDFYPRSKNKLPTRPQDYQSRCIDCNPEVVRGYNQRKREALRNELNK